MTDSIIVIEPRWEDGSWVFDNKGEKLVLPEGIAAIIDDLVKDIAGAREGFRLALSPAPFRDYQVELTSAGYWYRDNGREGQGCSCPALFDCFETAPEAVYMRAEASGPHAPAPVDPEEITALRNRVDELEKIVYRLTMENELLKSGGVQEEPPPGGGGRYWVAEE